MPKINELEVLTDFHCLVYGKAGTGKTIFAAGFTPPVLIVDCDGGVLSVKTTNLLTVEQKENIWYETITETFYEEGKPGRVAPTAFKRVEKIFEELDRSGSYTDPTSKEKTEPKTVVLDSLSTFSDYALDDALWEANAINAVKVTQPQWGAQIRRIQRIIGYGRSLKSAHFVCVAHEQMQKDEHSGRIFCLPLTTGKFAQRIGSHFDEYYQATVETTLSGSEYKLLTHPSGMITARTRLDLPNKIKTDFKEIKKHLKERFGV